MATTSDLLMHYSSKAFQTRISALTFVGAMIAAESKWMSLEVGSNNFFGFALLLVVVSLGELNRSYTHSYRCALMSAAKFSEDGAWKIFRFYNEYPYVGSSSSVLYRFLLSWLTYIPGIVAGGYFIMYSGVGGINCLGYFGVALGIAAPIRWWRLSDKATKDFEAINDAWDEKEAVKRKHLLRNITITINELGENPTLKHT